VSVPKWFLFLYFKYWYFHSLKRFWDCDFDFVNVLELHHSMDNDKWCNKRVLIKINCGQIGDQTGIFYTTNPVFYTSGNRFVRRTGTFGNLTFSLVPSDNRNTRSTCPTSVFTGIGQTLSGYLSADKGSPVLIISWWLFYLFLIDQFKCRTF
jgi:hypothetical protein